jgi:predicted DNA-binding protein (MmcQ/YjbR family)
VSMGTPHAENDEQVLDRLRAICLRFPEVEERGGVGNPSFKVRGKIFAMRHSLHEVDRWSVWFKASPGVQELVVGNDATRFFVPPYVGSKGWIGAYLDVEQDWDELADFVEESYRMTAPKRLVSRLDARAPGSDRNS